MHHKTRDHETDFIRLIEGYISLIGEGIFFFNFPCTASMSRKNLIGLEYIKIKYTTWFINDCKNNNEKFIHYIVTYS